MSSDLPDAEQRKLKSLLADFNSAAEPGPFAYEWCHHHPGERPFHLVLGAMVHGNEFGSLPAILRLVQALRSGALVPKVQLTVFIGNPEAALVNRRYLQADLNRVFLDNPHHGHEHERARAIMPILDQADAFIDFHQTIEETKQPFYIFPWSPEGWYWARAMQSARVWVTRDPSTQFAQGTRCTDEYVCLRGKPGLTVELSQKGFHPEAEALCWQSILAAIRTAEAINDQQSLADVAAVQPDLEFYTPTHLEEFASAEHTLRSGLVNFQPVTAGERLSADGAPELIAPADGMLLFPKYPDRVQGRAVAPLPSQIYRILTPLSAHPSTLWTTGDKS
jgi:succinylglutamate desuccinylase